MSLTNTQPGHSQLIATLTKGEIVSNIELVFSMMQSFIQLDQHYLAVKEVALEVIVTEPIKFDSKTLIHSMSI